MKHLFVHIGDTHIAPGPRLQDKLDAIDQIIVWCDEASARGELAAILWPGDLFHQKSTIEDRNLLAPRLQRLAQRAPVVLVDGNHDAPGDLDILSRLHGFYPIHVVSRPEAIRVHLGTQTLDAHIFCLPYPHKGGLVSAGVEQSDLGQTAQQLLESVFAVNAEELRDARDAGAVPLFIGHVNVGGAVSSTGQPQIGREIELEPGLLGRLDAAVYKGLNHIHKHQVVAGDTVYAGSICRQDFGENEAKGFVVVTYDDTTAQASWEFIPLEVPEQLLIKGRLSREGFQFDHDDWMCRACAGTSDGVVEVVGDGVAPCRSCDGTGKRSWKGADIKVQYRYIHSEHSVLDTAHILAEFAGCRQLKLDAIAEMEHSVRAPEVAAAVTLGDKCKAYCTHRSIAWTPGIAAKLDALQQQSPEQILAAVEAMATQTATPTAAKAVA